MAAAGPTNQPPLLKFDRYVAINTPVRLLHGVSKLDEFYRAPLDWPQAERTDDIENTFLKVAALSKNTLTPQTSLPFNAIESKFLIGLTFRLHAAGHYFQQPAAEQSGSPATPDLGFEAGAGVSGNPSVFLPGLF